jgi:hypothetical protein
LNPSPEIDSIVAEEAQKRLQSYKADELKTVSYEKVMEKYK